MTDVTEEVASLRAPVTEVTVEDTHGGISDMLAEGEEAVGMAEIAASPQAARAASTRRTPFGSGKVNLVDRFVDVVETELSLPGAEIVSNVEVTERHGAMDSETETVAGGSVGVVVLERVVGKVEVGSSGVVPLASRTGGSLSGSGTLVGVVAATLGSTESVPMSVSERGTVLVHRVESVTGFAVVGTVGVVGAVSAGAAGAGEAAFGLSLVGVFDSPSCIWANSFSGVLRPDVERGGPGLMTGFGSKAGFPADSCAETLERI